LGSRNSERRLKAATLHALFPHPVKKYAQSLRNFLPTGVFICM